MSRKRVLGILSDIFEEFDELCERHSIDKVKTIGDAYIVSAGALSEPCDDDAHRILRMGLAMQLAVRAKVAAEGVDIAVRIGVHTGRVTGGIIGTRRFHFDMWGNGVNGATRFSSHTHFFVQNCVHTCDECTATFSDHMSLTPCF